MKKISNVELIIPEASNTDVSENLPGHYVFTDRPFIIPDRLNYTRSAHLSSIEHRNGLQLEYYATFVPRGEKMRRVRTTVYRVTLRIIIQKRTVFVNGIIWRGIPSRDSACDRRNGNFASGAEFLRAEYESDCETNITFSSNGISFVAQIVYDAMNYARLRSRPRVSIKYGN